MSKRKYKYFIDITIILLCLLPLVSLLFATARNEFAMTSEEMISHVNTYTISDDFTNTVRNALNTCRINCNGTFGNIAYMIMANSMLIHIFYVFVSVLCYIPKLSIKCSIEYCSAETFNLPVANSLLNKAIKSVADKEKSCNFK